MGSIEDPAISSLSADSAYYQCGGYLLAHEILHAIGAKHHGDKTSIMTATPSWTWIRVPPTIKPKTVKQVKRKLGAK
jgi:hypothetical protein